MLPIGPVINWILRRASNAVQCLHQFPGDFFEFSSILLREKTPPWSAYRVLSHENNLLFKSVSQSVGLLVIKQCFFLSTCILSLSINVNECVVHCLLNSPYLLFSPRVIIINMVISFFLWYIESDKLKKNAMNFFPTWGFLLILWKDRTGSVFISRKKIHSPAYEE